jgi:hypothetical protein
MLVLRSSAGMAARTSKQRPSGAFHKPVPTTAAERCRCSSLRLGSAFRGGAKVSVQKDAGQACDGIGQGMVWLMVCPGNRSAIGELVQGMISELDWVLFVREEFSLFARTHSSSKADSLIASAVSGRRVTNVLRAKESRHSRHPPKYEMVFPSLQGMMVGRRRSVVGASLLG